MSGGDDTPAECWPDLAGIPQWTDHYFLRTKQVVGKFGDQTVTYAVFMRRPVLYAARLMLDWLRTVTTARGVDVRIDEQFQEGDWVGAGEPMVYLTGSFFHLVDLETIYLQKLGAACVAANNAYTLCSDQPGIAFRAMDARD